MQDTMESRPPATDPGPTDAAALNGDAILVADKVTMRFGGLFANRDVDFRVPRGSIVSLIGPNGAGKTTFFNQLTGMLEPTSGEIAFEGASIVGMEPHEIAELGIGRTFQNIRLFGAMTSLANVMVGSHHRLRASWWASLLKLPRARAEEVAVEQKARELLELVGLRRRYYDDAARNLPYGDQRRLELARALAGEPKLLLLDEPTAGMNPGETAQMTALIRRIRYELNLTVLLIEHDMKVVMGISERITVLDHGELLAEGTPEEIRANSMVIEAYLGKQETSA
jgi:branched-chain amino acid transport system ATP-binding protein